MNGVSDSIGCQYSVSASGTVTFNVNENNGSIAGTATTLVHIDIVTTYTPPNDTCTGLPFDATMSGDITGSDASLTANLATSGGAGRFMFTGSRSSATITGSADVSYALVDNSGTTHPSKGSTGNFDATKQ
jgi:hypothetical protein